jgi:hypothetical protein
MFIIKTHPITLALAHTHTPELMDGYDFTLGPTGHDIIIFQSGAKSSANSPCN